MRAFIIFSLVFSLTFITYMKFNNYYPFKKFHKTNEDKGAGINGALFQDISKSVIQVFYPEIQQFITDINLIIHSGDSLQKELIHLDIAMIC